MKTEDDTGDGRKEQFISDFLTELKAFEELKTPGQEQAVEGLLSLASSIPGPSTAPVHETSEASAPLVFPDINDADIKDLLGANHAELGPLVEQGSLDVLEEGGDVGRPQSWPSPNRFLSPDVATDEDGRSVSMPCLAALLPMALPEKPPTTITMLGQAIALISSKDLPQGNFVRTSDIFHKFFSKRHWDEFKTILEKNGVEPLVVPEEKRANFTVEVMRVSEVEALLLRNEARKEGFVRCRTLDSQGGHGSSLFADSVIQATQERPPFELSSGIKTRHGDHSDIVYVKLEGRTLPAVAINDEEYVRLADVQLKILDSEPQGNRTEMERIRRACARLGIGVEKIPASVKWRLVAQAGSARSNSLHVIPTRLLPNLVGELRNPAHLRRKRALQAESSGIPMEVDSGSDLVAELGGDGDLSEYDEMEDDEDLASLSPGSRQAFGLPPLAPSPPPVPVPPWNAEYRDLQPSATFLASRNVSPELQALLRPCRVTLPRAPVLKVAVCSARANHPSVFGNYLDHLFLYPNAPCVECTVCMEMFSIPVFLRHHHAAWFDHQAPKLHMYLAGFNHCPPRFDLWARLDRKLRDFGMLEHAFTFPDHLVEYYRKRWAKEVRAPPASKLKSAAGGWRTNRRPSRAVSASDRLAKARPDSPLDQLIEEAGTKLARRPRRVAEPLEGRLTCAVKVAKGGSLETLYERTSGSLAADWAALGRFPVGLRCPEKEAILARLYGSPP